MKSLSLTLLKNETIRSAKRFPVTFLFVIIATATLIAMTEMHLKFNEGHPLTDFVLVLILALPISLAFHLIAENKPKWLVVPSKWVPYLSFIPLLAFFIWRQSHYGACEWIRFSQWVLYSHLLVAFAPFLQNSNSRAFWNFNYALFINFLISRFFGLFLWVGFSLALAAVGALLEIRISSEFYFNLSSLCLVLISTLHFLALMPESINFAEERPRLLKIFCQYILVPLNVTYAAILYIYLIKILVTGDWPKGMISWLVSGVSILGVFALLMMATFFDQNENRWMKKFQSIYYVSIIPLLIMGLVSLFQRIDQYRLTEKRYALIALSLWLIGIAVYNLVSKAKNILVIPVSLFVVSFLTSFGPWGMYQTSWLSQKSRMVELLVKSDAIKNGFLVKNSKDISLKDAKEINQILGYLVYFHGSEELPSFFTDVDTAELVRISKKDSSYLVYDEVGNFMEKRLALPSGLNLDKVDNISKYIYYDNHSRVVQISNDVLFFRFDSGHTIYPSTETGKSYELSVDDLNFTLQLKENGKIIIEHDLRSYVAEIIDLDSEQKGLAWTFNAQGLEVTLIPQHVSADNYAKGLRNLSLSGSLLVRFFK